ncbi:MAG: cytochrome c oxidase accessory protein CcoG [Methylovirgula sp.]
MNIMNAKEVGGVGETAGGDSLYAAPPKIYSQSVHGTFRRIKWTVLAITLGIYYFIPFLRFDRGPNEPSQAVLVDFASHRFYFFFIEIWPQEVYYFTGLLILASLVLFLMTALAGRVWCGYICPQTVWTDLFIAIERLVEGDRREHIRSDAGPPTPARVARKATKHFLWLMIALWTGCAWVLYFADAPTLVHDLATFQAPAIAYIFIGIVAFMNYALAGHMREQICIYMCPWPRIQAALTDEYALNVTYRYDRGEPRTSLKKGRALRSAGARAGDCIDCGQCVAVCPTGVDIRHGPDLGCIQCGLCIDACDNVMRKIGRPPRLIAYDTDVNIQRRLAGLPNVFRPIRTRTVLYTAMIALVGGIMLATLVTRSHLGVNVLHDRNPLYLELADGSIRNAYTVRILNHTTVTKSYVLKVAPFAPANVTAIGTGKSSAGWPRVEIGPDQTYELRVLVTLPATADSEASRDVTFEAVDETTGETATTRDHFLTR